MADPTSVKPDDDSAFWSNNPRGIPLQALFGANKGSGEIGMRLKAHDVSGDGYLDKTEFRNAISNEIAAVKSTKQLKMVVLVLAVLVIAICGVMTGLTYAVVEMSKETGVSSNGVMTKKGTNEAVSVAHATSHSKLTSKLPDEAFEQMEKLEVISPTGSRLVMNVLGWARVMDAMAIGGSYVRLVTAEGKVKLDGSVMTFEGDVDSFFAEVGFTTTAAGGGRRRLTSVYKLMALLNAVKDWGNLDEDVERKPGFNHGSFVMEMEMSVPCKARKTDIEGVTTTMCHGGVHANGTIKAPLRGTRIIDGELRMVVKKRIEYNKASGVYAEITQLAEFPGFASVEIKVPGDNTTWGYSYQAEIKGVGSSLEPMANQPELFKCAAGTAEDPVQPPDIANKIRDVVESGKNVREFEMLFKATDTMLSFFNDDYPEDGLTSTFEANGMFTNGTDGELYMRILYFDDKDTGAPVRFSWPTPDGGFDYSVTSFNYESPDAGRWALVGGASNPRCKPDPENSLIPALRNSHYAKNRRMSGKQFGTIDAGNNTAFTPNERRRLEQLDIHPVSARMIGHWRLEHGDDGLPMGAKVVIDKDGHEWIRIPQEHVPGITDKLEASLPDLFMDNNNTTMADGERRKLAECGGFPMPTFKMDFKNLGEAGCQCDGGWITCYFEAKNGEASQTIDTVIAHKWYPTGSIAFAWHTGTRTISFSSATVAWEGTREWKKERCVGWGWARKCAEGGVDSKIRFYIGVGKEDGHWGIFAGASGEFGISFGAVTIQGVVQGQIDLPFESTWYPPLSGSGKLLQTAEFSAQASACIEVLGSVQLCGDLEGKRVWNLPQIPW